MEQIQSSSYKKMSKRSGQYQKGKDPMRKLNVSTPPITVKSTNQMKKTTSKSFPTPVRASNRPTNMSKVAVSKVTKGMKGSGKSISSGTKGVNVKRVDQISPAQKGMKTSPTSKTVASNPRGQNKMPRNSMSKVMKSLKKTMGY